MMCKHMFMRVYVCLGMFMCLVLVDCGGLCQGVLGCERFLAWCETLFHSAPCEMKYSEIRSEVF